MDVIISGGTVIDGTGSPGIRADVGILDGKIATLGDLAGVEARERIDATNRFVTPGFIDMHSHSDFSLLSDPRAISRVSQGITTEVVGNCGLAAAPVSAAYARDLQIYTQSIAYEMDWNWKSMDQFLTRIAEVRPATNVAPLSAHGGVRLAVLGFANRNPAEAEMNQMRQLVREDMEAGAFGISTGLIYSPGCYAKTEEIAALAQVVAGFGGFYATHLRDESARLLPAIKEALEIGRQAGIPVHISHMKSAGKSYFGRIDQALALIDQAGEQMDASGDFYPYSAGCTLLSALLPPWCRDTNVDGMLRKLADREVRSRLKAEMPGESEEWWNAMALAGGWDHVMIVGVESAEKKGVEGHYISELAAKAGLDPIDYICDLLIQEGGSVMIIIFMIGEGDMEKLAIHPRVSLGSDGFAVAPEGPTSRKKVHPRYYGTFPRFLRIYVREKGLITWEEGVRKMTSLSAARLGLKDRGVLRSGNWADVVVFDPESISDTASYVDPHRLAVGIDCVMVNGRIVMREGRHTGVRPGIVLRKNR